MSSTKELRKRRFEKRLKYQQSQRKEPKAKKARKAKGPKPQSEPVLSLDGLLDPLPAKPKPPVDTHAGFVRVPDGMGEDGIPKFRFQEVKRSAADQRRILRHQKWLARKKAKAEGREVVQERIMAYVQYEDEKGRPMMQQLDEPDDGWKSEEEALEAAQKAAEKFDPETKARGITRLIDPRPEGKAD